MVWHKTPSQNIAYWLKIKMTLAEKVKIIFIVEKNLLLIISTVINMINTGAVNIH